MSEFEMSQVEKRTALTAGGDYSETTINAIVAKWDAYLASVGDEVAETWTDYSNAH